jgi:hypothetical protein
MTIGFAVQAAAKWTFWWTLQPLICIPRLLSPPKECWQVTGGMDDRNDDDSVVFHTVDHPKAIDAELSELDPRVL